jgi:hypothetical protein
MEGAPKAKEAKRNTLEIFMLVMEMRFEGQEKGAGLPLYIAMLAFLIAAA